MAISEVLGPDADVDTHQSLGSEDFAWFLEHAPGAMIRLGAAQPERQFDLHSSTLDLDERAIEVGILTAVACLVELIERAGR